MIRALAGLLGGCFLFAQPPEAPLARLPETPLTEPARIEGQVLNDSNGLPLRRAHVTLRPLEVGLTAAGAEADDKGHFALRNITPGRYSLIAERDGYVSSAAALRGTLRMPSSFYIGDGEDIADITFRLRPWAVVAGKVKFDDGEPGVGVRVDLYQQFHARGRHGYRVVTSAQTDDRGEYRVYGLQAGAYLLAANYQRSSPRGFQDQPPTDGQGRELPVTGYTTTFYPNTEKLSEALPVRVDYGQELDGVDIFLNRVRKVKIRGSVLDGVSGEKLDNAAITLAHVDSSVFGTIPAAAQASFDRDGNFQIPDVAPGSYLLEAQAGDSGKTLLGRRLLTVSNEDLNNVDLIAEPPLPWSAVIKIEGGTGLALNRPVRVTLQPRSDTGSPVQLSVRGEKFDCTVMSSDVYDVLVDNLPEDLYLAAVLVGGTDVRESGLQGDQASETPFEIVLDSRGAKVSGRVFGPDESVWSGANLMLIPDSPEGRIQDYRPGAADQYGQFEIRGAAPGNYILVAWLDAPPCDVYDAGDLETCRAAGMSLTVEHGSDLNLMLNMKNPPKP